MAGTSAMDGRSMLGQTPRTSQGTLPVDSARPDVSGPSSMVAPHDGSAAAKKGARGIETAAPRHGQPPRSSRGPLPGGSARSGGSCPASAGANSGVFFPVSTVAPPGSTAPARMWEQPGGSGTAIKFPKSGSSFLANMGARPPGSGPASAVVQPGSSVPAKTAARLGGFVPGTAMAPPDSSVPHGAATKIPKSVGFFPGTRVAAPSSSAPAKTTPRPGAAAPPSASAGASGGLATTGMWSGGIPFSDWLAAEIGASNLMSDPSAAATFPPTFAMAAPGGTSSTYSGDGKGRVTAAMDESTLAQGARKRKGKGTGGKKALKPKAVAPADSSGDILDLAGGRFLCGTDESETDDSDKEESESDDDDEWRSRTLEVMRSLQNNLFATALVLGKYYMTYYDKNEETIPVQSGFGWVRETLKKPGGCQKMFRMSLNLFYSLHALLVSEYGLQSSTNMVSLEMLAMFFVICGHGWSNSATQHIFKHSSETISRKFGEVLDVVVAMCKHYIRPINPNFATTHSRITSDHRMMPHFKDCIGALDGTHITAVPDLEDFIRYIGRSGKPTQNVMAVVDFDLRFTYASVGQPGSMHDTSVLFHALEHDEENFPHPPKGKYYLVDAGYPNRDGYLAPFKNERYHVPDWKRGQPPTGEQEKFNHLHSSIRNAVECTFGVWKVKWRILLKMPSYPMEKQKMIVAATMCLHNYICENSDNDKHFLKCDRNVDYIPTIPQRYARYLPSSNASDTSTPQASQCTMNKFRDNIAKAISSSRSR